MTRWRSTLAALVAARHSREFPLSVYRAEPPASLPWPQDLPSSEPIRDFFSLCDGGLMGSYRFASVSHLPALNRKWLLAAAHRGPARAPVLLAGHHVVLGEEECDSPLVWHADTDCMGVAWHNGLPFDSYNQSFEAFLDELFTPRSLDLSSAWDRALRQLSNSAT